MTDDLLKRLRDPDYKYAKGNCFEGLLRDLCDEAADRIEKLEAALRIVINWDSTLESEDGLDWGEVMDIASKALERKDGV